MRERPGEKISWWQAVRAPVGLMGLACAMAFGGYLLTGPAQVRAEPAPGGIAEAEQIGRALTATRPPLPAGMPTGRPARLGKPFDALTAGEIGYARWLAVRHQRNPGWRVDGSPGYEFLSATLAADQAARRVAVTSYDYAAN